MPGALHCPQTPTPHHNAPPPTQRAILSSAAPRTAWLDAKLKIAVRLVRDLELSSAPHGVARRKAQDRRERRRRLLAEAVSATLLEHAYCSHCGARRVTNG